MNLEEFLNKYRISEEDFRKTGLIWDDLIGIKDHYDSLRESLEQVARDTSERLRKSTPKVHSVKFRVKNSEHLVEKIIRKRIKNTSRMINLSNYHAEITDLVGVRVLHLFKEDWGHIHDHIVANWDRNEDPIAYYREGDLESHIKAFEEKGCRREKHEYGYRSVHYVIKTAPTKNTNFVEIQVRTLFEEAWSEIDHQIRYPYDQKNKLLMPYLVMFNRLAGSADEMGSYVRTLQAALGDYEEKRKMHVQESGDKISALEDKIKKLEITAAQKNELEIELKSLKGQYLPLVNLYDNPLDDAFWKSMSDSASLALSDFSALELSKTLQSMSTGSSITIGTKDLFSKSGDPLQVRKLGQVEEDMKHVLNPDLRTKDRNDKK